MKSKVLFLIAGIAIGMGAIIFYNSWAKTPKHKLGVLPTPYYKVLYENDNIRILDHHLNPGEIEPMHSHPQMYAYFIDSAEVIRIGSDGSRTSKSFSKGENFLAQAQNHSIENSGDKPLHTILVELK